MSNIEDPEAKELVELITLEIGKYGGFQYIDIGQTILDTRSIKISKQIIQALYDASTE